MKADLLTPTLLTPDLRTPDLQTPDLQTRLVVCETREELATVRAALTGRVAVVMTMGALHEGHAALIRAAHERADAVVVTVFVNPLQFGPSEDLTRYPRTLSADLALCAEQGVDVVFAPPPGEVYCQPAQVTVAAGALGTRLEGQSRPGHFDGVLTVVLKLMHLVRPDVALFGDKDAQQLACVRQMVRDLDVPVEVVGVETVREADGLALSSRNRYLSAEGRAASRVLSRALATRDVAAGRALLDAEPAVETVYFERVDSATFLPDDRGDLLVVAARVGATRLIDNLRLDNLRLDNLRLDNPRLDDRPQPRPAAAR